MGVTWPLELEPPTLRLACGGYCSGISWLLVVPVRVHAVPSWSCFSVVLSVRLGSTLSPCSLSLFYLLQPLFLSSSYLFFSFNPPGRRGAVQAAACAADDLSRAARGGTVCVVRRRKPRGACSGLPAERRGVWLHSRIRRLTRLTFAWRDAVVRCPPRSALRALACRGRTWRCRLHDHAVASMGRRGCFTPRHASRHTRESTSAGFRRRLA